jgi:hypothetical protein
MEDQLMLEIKDLPVYLQEEVKDFVHFLKKKLENHPPKNTIAKNARKAGFLKGTFIMSADFDEPMDDFKEYM